MTTVAVQNYRSRNFRLYMQRMTNSCCAELQIINSTHDNYSYCAELQIKNFRLYIQPMATSCCAELQIKNFKLHIQPMTTSCCAEL